MKISELKKIIKTFLLTKTSRVYNMRATSDSQYPYLVFDIPNSISSFHPAQDFRLEINIWDDEQDTTALEILTDSIDGDGHPLSPSGLNKKTIQSNGITATFHTESRDEILDEDDRIHRRQLTYTVRTYYEGG